MQRSLFCKGGIQSGLLPCDFVGSCVLSAVVVWVIHYDRANPAHSFKTGLMNQSLWMCLVVEVYVRDCLVKWLFYMQLTHVWVHFCICVNVQAPCFIELVFIICCYMKTVLYLTHDPSITTILHRKWHRWQVLEGRSKMDAC